MTALNKKTVLLATIVFLHLARAAFALDFGLTLNQAGEATNVAQDNTETQFIYSGSYQPWLAVELSETLRLHLSARVGMDYKDKVWQYGDAAILPELERFSLSWRPAPAYTLEAGRVQFQDPLGIIAKGLFDGATGSAVLGDYRLTGGLFYTGLLYKESAKVVLSPADYENYVQPMGKFDSYFASRRMLFALGAEFPGITETTALALQGLFQFDVNENPTVHTQYLTAQYTVFQTNTLTLTGTGVAGLLENNRKETLAHFALAGGAEWEVPGPLQDLAEAEIRWSSGAEDGGSSHIAPFTPVTVISQGEVFTPALSALSVFSLKYTLRLRPNFISSLKGNYFTRNDSKTIAGATYKPSDARFLGGELFASFIWAPATDCMVALGLGAFFPGMGNVFDADAPVLWKCAAGVTLSL
ncbi:MAG: hypothetical protein LBT39_01585 [Treponema sp.]|jgi:hypothetical protein|nr:hypothetical protein [Treponema sp.]